MKELNQKFIEISRILTDIDHTLNIIESSYIVISSLKNNPELQTIYAQETLPFIDDYRYLRQELLSKLEEYFDLEVKSNVPRKLYMRKLYQGIKSNKTKV